MGLLIQIGSCHLLYGFETENVIKSDEIGVRTTKIGFLPVQATIILYQKSKIYPKHDYSLLQITRRSVPMAIAVDAP